MINSNISITDQNVRRDDFKFFRIWDIEDKSPDSFKNDIDNLKDWTNAWSLELNVSICKVMRFAKKNTRFKYFLKDKSSNQYVLQEPTVERDFEREFI